MQLIIFCILVGALIIGIFFLNESYPIKLYFFIPLSKVLRNCTHRFGLKRRGGKASKEINSNALCPTSLFSSSLQNYNDYKMSSKERIKYILMAAIILFVIGLIFYQNLFLCLCLSTLSVASPKMIIPYLKSKRKYALNMQFKDAMIALSSSLTAGKSVENSFRDSLNDLRLIYPEPNVYINYEFEWICRKVEMNAPIETALQDFAQRADIDDITNFVDVFLVCKATGGNLIEVIKNASIILNQKIEVKNEIDILIAEQKFSQRILSVAPFILLVLMKFSSPDYIAPLYSPIGMIVMTVVLILIAIAYFISEKISSIKL